MNHSQALLLVTMGWIFGYATCFSFKKSKELLAYRKGYNDQRTLWITFTENMVKQACHNISKVNVKRERAHSKDLDQYVIYFEVQ